MATETKSTFDDLPDNAYLRQPQVLEIVPFSSATLWRKCSKSQVPKPVKLSERVTGWKVGHIREWLATQAAL